MLQARVADPVLCGMLAGKMIRANARGIDIALERESGLRTRLSEQGREALLSIILETSVGRVRVCVWCVVWQGATTRHGCSLQGGATQPGGAPGVQSDA